MSYYQNDYLKTWFTVDPSTVLDISQTSSSTTAIYELSKVALWALKDRLTSAGTGAWTVLASSGKAGGGSLVADTKDNWLTEADLVRGANDAADRSWILLKSPDRLAGFFYLLLDYFGADDGRINLYFTKSAPDIGSPAVNARPPATGDEWSHLNQYICLDGGDVRLFSITAVRASDGSFFIAFGAPALSEIDEGQYFRAIYMFNVIRPSKSWDSTGAVSAVWTNLDAALLYSSNITFQSLHSDGSQVTLAPIYLQVYLWPLNLWSFTDPYRGGYSTTPVWLVSTTTSKKCIRGSLEDVFWVSDVMADGQLLFKNELVKAVKIGAFTCPMDQVSGLP